MSLGFNLESYLIYIVAVAVLIGVIGWVWLLVVSFRSHTAWGVATILVPPTALIFIPTHWKKARKPFSLMLMAGVVGLFPLVFAQVAPYLIRLGPYEKIVDGERHLTLTGWDRDDYSIVQDRKDVVVLQMANPDVTDETLRYLEGLEQLRELDLDYTQVTDVGLEQVASLPALQKLRLRKTAISDEGFRKHLADKESLLELDLQQTSVASKTLRQWKAARDGRKYLK